MIKDIIFELGAPFQFEEVEAKVQVTSKDNSKGLRGMVVFYLDSRTIQKRLDDVLGHLNWKNQYSMWHDFEAGDTKKVQKSQICGIAIYNDERNEWVGKFDGAECSNIEPIKGGLSDSFKRAACMWGIGRYLYEMEGIWVDVEQRGNSSYIKDNQKGILKAAYENAVKKIFGPGAKQPTANDNTPNTGSSAAVDTQPNQQQPTPTAPSPQNTNTEPPPMQQSSNTEQKPQGNVLAMHDFKIHSIKPAGKESQLLELCNREGEITSAYIRSNEQGIAVGVHLRNVQFEEKNGSYGKYNLLTKYEVAA